MKKAICLGILSLTLVGGLIAQPTLGTKDSKPSSFDEGYNLVSESTVTVTTPVSNIEVGSNFTVPVTVSDTTGRGIIAYQFDLYYNPAVIQPQPNAVDLAGTISSGLSAVYNPISPGVLKVAVYGAHPLTGSGILLNFKFTAVGPAWSTSSLTWGNFMFNEGNPAANAANGQITLIPKPIINVTTAFTGRETAMEKLDILNNIYRGNTLALISDDTANATSMTVSFDLVRVSGQAGMYNIVGGRWTMMIYRNGVYTGSLYGEIIRGRACDVFDNVTGAVMQRTSRGRFQITGGMGSYENIDLQEIGIGEFSFVTDYTIGKRSTAVFNYSL